MVVAAGRGLGGAGIVLLLVGLAPHLIRRLIELLVGGHQFRLMLVVSPTGEADLAGGAVGFEQRRLLRHVCVRCDLPADVELLIRPLVFLEELKIVGGVGLRLPELLLPHHVHLMGTGMIMVRCTGEDGVGSSSGASFIGTFRRYRVIMIRMYFIW